MSVSLDPTADVAAPLEKASWIEEAQCGKLGFSIVTVNTVASAIFLGYLAKPLEMGLGFAAAWATVKVDEKTGIWEGKFADWAHFYDGRLSQGLQGFFQNEHAHSIMDLGCGTGAYVNDLRKANLQCDGCDGNPDPPKLGGEHCKVVDLAQRDLDLRTNRGEKYDWAFSLEVGEHLPKEHEQAFLDNVVNT